MPIVSTHNTCVLSCVADATTQGTGWSILDVGHPPNLVNIACRFTQLTAFSSGGPYGQVIGSADLTAGFVDTLTVTSSTLAPGTPVALQLTMLLSAELSCYGANGQTASVIQTMQLGAGFLSASDSGCATGINKVQKTIVSSTVGSTLGLEGQLVMNVSGGTQQLDQYTNQVLDSSGESSTVDPPNGAVFIDSETVGASYTTASGVSYASPVPLPASNFLLFSGVGCLLAFGGLRHKAGPARKDATAGTSDSSKSSR